MAQALPALPPVQDLVLQSITRPGWDPHRHLLQLLSQLKPPSIDWDDPDTAPTSHTAGIRPFTSPAVSFCLYPFSALPCHTEACSTLLWSLQRSPHSSLLNSVLLLLPCTVSRGNSNFRHANMPTALHTQVFSNGPPGA